MISTNQLRKRLLSCKTVGKLVNRTVLESVARGGGAIPPGMGPGGTAIGGTILGGSGGADDDMVLRDRSMTTRAGRKRICPHRVSIGVCVESPQRCDSCGTGSTITLTINTSSSIFSLVHQTP